MASDNANQFRISVPDAASERYRHRDVEEEEDDDGDHEEDERRQLINRVPLRKRRKGTRYIQSLLPQYSTFTAFFLDLVNKLCNLGRICSMMASRCVDFVSTVSFCGPRKSTTTTPVTSSSSGFDLNKSCRKLQCLLVMAKGLMFLGETKSRARGGKEMHNFLSAVSPAAAAVARRRGGADKSSFFLETRMGAGYYTASDLLFQNKLSKLTRFIPQLFRYPS